MKKSRILLAASLVGFQLSGYEVLLISDTHYDRIDLKRDNLSENAKKELARNKQCWQFIPKMFAEIPKNFDFGVHLGDFVQGDLRNVASHEQVLHEALQVMKNNFKFPFYYLRGNHDDRGTAGAEATYKRIMLPLLPCKNQTGGSRAFVYNKDIFILFDCINPDFAFVEKALRDNANVQHTFFLSHYPVLPSMKGWHTPWLCFYDLDRQPEKKQPELEKLLAALARRKAIVLCGHIHRTTFTTYKLPGGGSIDQFSIYSMPANAPVSKWSKTTETGEHFLDSVMSFNEEDMPKIAKLFCGKMKTWTIYEPDTGYARLRVSENGEVAIIYHPWMQPCIEQKIIIRPAM